MTVFYVARQLQIPEKYSPKNRNIGNTYDHDLSEESTFSSGYNTLIKNYISMQDQISPANNISNDISTHILLVDDI